MPGFADYLAWRGDLSFAQDPFHPVDGLLLSTLAYHHFAQYADPPVGVGIPFHQVAEQILSQPPERLRVFASGKRDANLLRQTANSPRFRDQLLWASQEVLDISQQIQFAAITLQLDYGAAVVFRGTDNTLVGWKEDFNLGFLDTLPGQWLARDYLEQTAAYLRGPLWVCGHSKGGNLAVFAASQVSLAVQNRIVAVYNQDGPGFSRSVVEQPGYQAILPKLETFVPQFSVFGMLLEHEEPYTVVKSRGMGMMQHDPYAWEIQGNDFIRLTQVSNASRVIDSAMRRWLAGLTSGQREEFVDGLYELLAASNARTLEELANPKKIMAIWRQYTQKDKEKRKQMGQILRRLARAAAWAAREQGKQNNNKHQPEG